MEEIVATMAGTLFKVLVSIGEQVEPGQKVVILESMKMEIPIESMESGVVKEIYFQEGDFVNEGDPLISILKT